MEQAPASLQVNYTIEPLLPNTFGVQGTVRPQQWES